MVIGDEGWSGSEEPMSEFDSDAMKKEGGAMKKEERMGDAIDQVRAGNHIP